jgi:hypothetical protein
MMLSSDRYQTISIIVLAATISVIVLAATISVIVLAAAYLLLHVMFLSVYVILMSKVFKIQKN